MDSDVKKVTAGKILGPSRNLLLMLRICFRLKKPVAWTLKKPVADANSICGKWAFPKLP